MSTKTTRGQQAGPDRHGRHQLGNSAVIATHEGTSDDMNDLRGNVQTLGAACDATAPLADSKETL